MEASTPLPTSTGSSELDLAIKCYVDYCLERSITGPVEVLRCAQSAVITGRDLDETRLLESLDRDTNFINIDRYVVH